MIAVSDITERTVAKSVAMVESAAATGTCDPGTAASEGGQEPSTTVHDVSH